MSKDFKCDFVALVSSMKGLNYILAVRAILCGSPT